MKKTLLVALAAAALSAALQVPSTARAAMERTVAYHGDVTGFPALPEGAKAALAIILMHDFGGLDGEMRSRAPGTPVGR